MATVSTYPNFKDQTEEAFNSYRSVFGGEFIGNISSEGGKVNESTGYVLG